MKRTKCSTARRLLGSAAAAAMVAMVAIVATGCGVDDRKVNVAGATPPAACLDLADAVAQAAVRCGEGTYEQNFSSFVAAAAQGDCNNIVAVKDMSSLYSECIPSIQTLACADLSTGNLDPSCQSQLTRRAGPAPAPADSTAAAAIPSPP